MQAGVSPTHEWLVRRRQVQPTGIPMAGEHLGWFWTTRWSQES